MYRYVMAMMTALLLAPVAQAAGTQWVEGQNYSLIQPAQPTSVAPGKVEVVEVFSFACPACDRFYPIMDKLVASLPANAQVVYVPASFIPTEDWPVFQRAYYTAQTLGLDNKKTHDEMYDAIWKTGELAIEDTSTGRLKSPLPTIADVAKFYARVAGVQVQTFIDTASSFAVDVKIRRAEQLIQSYGADSTPTLVINGKYRVTPQSAGGYQQTLDLVRYLVAKEGGR